MAEAGPRSFTSSDSLTWSKKRKIKARIARLRLEKVSSSTSMSSSEASDRASSTKTVPEEEEDRPGHSSSGKSDMEIDEVFTEERAQDIFDDFVIALPRDVC